MANQIVVKKNSFFEDVLLTAGIGYGAYLLFKKAKEKNIQLPDILPSLEHFVKEATIITEPKKINDHPGPVKHTEPVISEKPVKNNEYKGFYGHSNN